MRLTFAYPPTWKASGATFVSTMGNVGRAQVTGDTAAPIAAFDAASCLKRVRLLHGPGAFVSWSADIGSPIPIRLSGMPGRKVWVNGHPAKLAADDLRHKIKSGKISGKLPGREKLAEEYGYAHLTGRTRAQHPEGRGLDLRRARPGRIRSLEELHTY